MDSSSIYYHSKASVFNKFKRFLYKCCPRFSKISRFGCHLNQFLVLLHDYVPGFSQLLSLEKLLKNDYFPQLGMGNNAYTLLCNDTTIRENHFNEKKAIQN